MRFAHIILHRRLWWCLAGAWVARSSLHPPVSLVLSLSVTEESVMSMTHEGASFPLPKEEWQGADNSKRRANWIDVHLQTR